MEYDSDTTQAAGADALEDLTAIPAGKTTGFPQFDVLGVQISAVDIECALKAIGEWIAQSRPSYVCVTPVHSVMECQRDEQVRAVYNEATMVTPDGMPIVWLGKLAGHRQIDRVYGPDLMLAVCERSVATGWQHFFYGGGEGVAERLREKLCQRFPGLRVVGTCCPPFRSLTEEEDAAVVRQIDRSGADVVWVGLGSPKQDLWMHAHLGRIRAPVMVGVGAAFDFHAGLKSQAPRFMQRSGLEWLYRLLCEPRRLGKRYMIGNPQFVIYLLLEKLGLRRS